MRRSAGIVVLALVAVSCGGGSTGATSGSGGTQPSSGATAPAAEGSYDSVRAMQLAVEKAFYLCNSPLKSYDPPLVEGAIEQADCTNAVGLVLFDPAAVGAGAAALQADGATTLIVGPNWIITCAADAATCEKIHGVTGGELITS